MTQLATVRNPFLLMISRGGVVGDGKSERLGALNRHLCRPLDRAQPAAGKPATAAEADREIDAADESEQAKPSDRRPAQGLSGAPGLMPDGRFCCSLDSGRCILC